MLNGTELLQQFNNISQAGNRQLFLPAWEDVRTYVLTQSVPIYGGSIDPGQRDRRNYESTPTIGLRNLSSVLMSSITNPSTKWVQLESDDDDLNKLYAVKEYFEALEKEITVAIENSNCYIKLHEFYRSLAGFGTAALFIEEGTGKNILNFRTVHISELYIAENKEGIVDTVFRKIKMTVRELAQKFGYDALSDELQKKLEENPYEYIDIIHAVAPRKDREMVNGQYKRNNKNLPFYDAWVEETTQNLLHEGGFRTFPFAVARWDKEVGNVYGYGPVMEAMADIKVLHSMKKDKTQFSNLQVKPPKAVIGGDKKKLVLKPNAINFFNEDTQITDLINYNGAIYHETQYQELKQSIQDALFANQLQSISRLDDKEMTAQEVQARQMENLRILGPIFSRIQNELLNPMISRIRDILDAGGYLPPIPEELKKSRVKFRFINPLTRAQKYDESNAIQAAVGTAIGWAAESGKIEILDNIDMDKAYRSFYENTGAPLDILKSDRDVKGVRQNRAQQEQEMLQMQGDAANAEIQETQAKAIEKMSRARKNMEE